MFLEEATVVSLQMAASIGTSRGSTRIVVTAFVEAAPIEVAVEVAATVEPAATLRARRGTPTKLIVWPAENHAHTQEKVSEGQAEKHSTAEGVGERQCHFVFGDFLGTEGYKPAEDVDRR